MRGIWFGTYVAGRPPLGLDDVVQRLAVAWPRRGAARSRRRARRGCPVSAGRQPMARAPCQPFAPLCIELPAHDDHRRAASSRSGGRARRCARPGSR